MIYERMERLQRIRNDPSVLPILKAYYREHPADFINDWGFTYDPRERPAVIPFTLYPRQREFIDWVMQLWKSREPGLVEKSRDMGASWLSISLACTLCLFHENMTVGFGSRKEEYVDKLDSPKSLFYKARFFMSYLPREFTGGWKASDAPYMRVKLPVTQSIITGEAGDNIGRGDRTSIYFVDEAAHIERPELIEASLSATTDCRIDLSSVNGMNNPFAKKRHSWPDRRIFIFDWRDDPRKDQAWYDKKCLEIMDDRVIAQEIDRDYLASVAGVIIPTAWVQSAIDAHIKLGITPTGKRIGGLDVADEGPDLNALAGRHGILLEHCESWTGKASDILATTEHAFVLADEWRLTDVQFDADGLGAGVRGDARAINARREAKINFEPYKGSGAPVNPDKPIPQINPAERSDILNADYFVNRKAQSWWNLRIKFARTHFAVLGRLENYDPDELISLPSGLNNLKQLTHELSQAVYKLNGAGKIIVDKAPKGTKSPNLADAVVIAYSDQKIRRSYFDV